MNTAAIGTSMDFTGYSIGSGTYMRDRPADTLELLGLLVSYGTRPKSQSGRPVVVSIACIECDFQAILCSAHFAGLPH
jgi:hypothetical protein